MLSGDDISESGEIKGVAAVSAGSASSCSEQHEVAGHNSSQRDAAPTRPTHSFFSSNRCNTEAKSDKRKGDREQENMPSNHERYDRSKVSDLSENARAKRSKCTDGFRSGMN